MAEAPRRSNETAGVKVITAPSNETSISEQTLRASLGARIQVCTANPLVPALEGTLYTACTQTSLVALSTGPTSSPAYHVIPMSSISFFSVLSLPNGMPPPLAPVLVNTNTLISRANTTMARAKERAAKVNKNVEKGTQDLFDALDKQFSARWGAKDIIVMERVVVKAPHYRSEDCRVITKDGEGLLERVRKVLENERKRAAQRDGGKAVRPAVPNIVPAVPAPQGLRKGG